MLKAQCLRTFKKSAQVNKISTLVTGQPHTLHADQKVLESRKDDDIALNTNKTFATAFHYKSICVLEEIYIKFLSLVDAVGPAREQTETEITDTVTTQTQTHTLKISF